MKPFLGIDLTMDRKNAQANGSGFMVAKPSLALTQTLERSYETAEAAAEQAKLPGWLRVLQYVCGLAAMVLAAGIMKAEVPMAEGYRNAPWIFWGAGVCAAIWLVLWLWSRQKEKAVFAAGESDQAFSNLEGASEAVYTELAVPAGAKETDILSFFYKEKNGAIKVCEKGMQLTQYFNPVFRVFSDDKYLYLANLDGKYAFPLTDILAIRTVKKHIRIAAWNKEEQYNKGSYKQYKLTVDNYGCIHCRRYHILEVRRNGEVWGIYIPPYELPVFEKLTGLKAE